MRTIFVWPWKYYGNQLGDQQQKLSLLVSGENPTSSWLAISWHRHIEGIDDTKILAKQRSSHVDFWASLKKTSLLILKEKTPSWIQNVQPNLDDQHIQKPKCCITCLEDLSTTATGAMGYRRSDARENVRKIADLKRLQAQAKGYMRKSKFGGWLVVEPPSPQKMYNI